MTILSDAFNYLLGKHCRTVSIVRFMDPDDGPDLTATITISPANYGRNIAGPEEIVTYGKEYVVRKMALVGTSFTTLKRGDQITDPELGLLMIEEVKPMYDFGGDILGYRIRTG